MTIPQGLATLLELEVNFFLQVFRRDGGYERGVWRRNEGI